MSEEKFQSRQIDDDTYNDPAFWKFGSYEMEREYYPLIGELVSTFNDLEETLSDELVEYIKNERMPNAAYLIIAGMSFSEKWNLWFTLLLNYINGYKGKLSMEEKEEHKFHESRIKEIKGSFERFGQIRNGVVHGSWATINEQGLIKTKTKTNKHKQLVHDHITVPTKDDFERLISDIEEFDTAFLEYNEKVRKEIEANHETEK